MWVLAGVFTSRIDFSTFEESHCTVMSEALPVDSTFFIILLGILALKALLSFKMVSL